MSLNALKQKYTLKPSTWHKCQWHDLESYPPEEQTVLAIFNSWLPNKRRFVAICVRKDKNKAILPGYKDKVVPVRSILFWSDDLYAIPPLALLEQPKQ